MGQSPTEGEPTGEPSPSRDASRNLGVRPLMSAPVPLPEGARKRAASSAGAAGTSSRGLFDLTCGQGADTIPADGLAEGPASSSSAPRPPDAGEGADSPGVGSLGAADDSKFHDGETEAASPVAGPLLDPLIVISMGSVVTFSGDAIVNAANTGCLFGGGVDGAIVEAGGQSLMEARQDLPTLDKRGTRCPTGDAKRTIGGELRAKWCIHAVGPNYCLMGGLKKDMLEGDDLLRSAYLQAMKRAEEVNVKTLAFSLLSAGIFRGRRTLEQVLDIALSAVEEGIYPGLEEVHLVAFTGEEIATLEELLNKRLAARGVTPTRYRKG